MPVLGRLVALLVLLLVGAGLRYTGVLDDERTAWLNAIAYYVALPALILSATYGRSIGSLLSVALLEGLVGVLVVTVMVAWTVHRRRPAEDKRSVAIVQSYHSNLGYLGLPLVAATFSEQVTAIASVVLGVLSLVQVPLTIVVLTAMNEADASRRAELESLVRNPVLIALLVGLAIGQAGVQVPGPVAGGLDGLGTLALPVALLCVGASLRVDRSAIDLESTGAVVALKIGVMPLLAWGIFSALAVDPATFTATVVMLGTPTAVSTYVYANELGGDAQFASLNVFVTTLVSTGTLFVLIRLVG